MRKWLTTITSHDSFNFPEAKAHLQRPPKGRECVEGDPTVKSLRSLGLRFTFEY